jgi:septal ring factor EnvC (AmiA/AmiB activator)
MSIIKDFKELTAGEKLVIAWTTVSVLFALVLIMYTVASTKGEEVSELKQRILALEQKLAAVDQKLDPLHSKDAELKNDIKQLEHRLFDLQSNQHQQEFAIGELRKAQPIKK